MHNMNVGSKKIGLTRNFPLKGVGETHLMTLDGKIYRQICINGMNLKNIKEFEIQMSYKYFFPLHI